MSKIKLLTFEEEQELGRRVQQDHCIESRNKLVEHNLLLVHFFARSYCQVELSDEYKDIVSRGNLGLIRAADKFDPNRGVKFSSYAGWWIKSFIQREYLREKSVVRMPLKDLHRYYRYMNVIKELTDKLERKPTIEECAEFMKLPLKTMTHIINTVPKIFSLSTDEEDFEDSVSKDLPSIDESGQNDARIDMENLFSKCKSLKDKERTILMERYYNDCTLETVAVKFSLTRERIRQIEHKALGKLRKYCRVNKIRLRGDY